MVLVNISKNHLYFYVFMIGLNIIGGDFLDEKNYKDYIYGVENFYKLDKYGVCKNIRDWFKFFWWRFFK